MPDVNNFIILIITLLLVTYVNGKQLVNIKLFRLIEMLKCHVECSVV
jgi:hypothetical protein